MLFRSRRTPVGSDEIQWDPQTGFVDLEPLRGVDAIIHLAGVIISGHTHDRWIVPITRNRIGRYGEKIDQQWHIKTGTYQNAPINFNGYAVEKGLSPKAGAGIWMKYTIDKVNQLQYNFQFAE